MARWLYIWVIKPVIYGAVVWWPVSASIFTSGGYPETATITYQHIQGTVCLDISLYVTDLTPISKSHGADHQKLIDQLKSTPKGLRSNAMPQKLKPDKKIPVRKTERKDSNWYTDGSKTEYGVGAVYMEDA